VLFFPFMKNEPHYTDFKMTLKTCPIGHQFHKSSDCPVCPVCEAARKPKDHFLSAVGAPARRALENNGITSLDQLCQFTEKQVLSFHGMGKSTIVKMKALMAARGLTFKVTQIK